MKAKEFLKSKGFKGFSENTTIPSIMEEYAKAKAWEAWKVGKRGDEGQWKYELVLFNQWWEQQQ
jgi:hypothetical protein